MKQPSSDAWWKRGVVYQVYVRSFQDTNGDGVGDLNGVRRRLDHVAGLGATGIWLNPIHPSPNHDWGYDVADYLAIDPELGTLDDFDRLVTAAGERGIGVILDLVPNHTSDVHPWFEEARSSRSSTRRDWYVWADPARDGGPPNNWRSVFGNSAWTLDPATEQYFLHNFLPEQPDLNWWNDEVRDEFDRVLRFWLRRGVSGFRWTWRTHSSTTESFATTPLSRRKIILRSRVSSSAPCTASTVPRRSRSTGAGGR